MSDIIRVSWTEELTWGTSYSAEEVLELTGASMEDIIDASDCLADGVCIHELDDEHTWLRRLVLHAQDSPYKDISFECEADHQITILKEGQQ